MSYAGLYGEHRGSAKLSHFEYPSRSIADPEKNRQFLRDLSDADYLFNSR